MTELESAIELKKKLLQKVYDYNELIKEEKDPIKLKELRNTRRIIQTMYKDVCQTIVDLDPSMKMNKSSKPKEARGNIDIDIEKGVGSCDLIGNIFNRNSGFGISENSDGFLNKRSIILRLIQEGYEKFCTPIERECLKLYYTDEMVIREISEIRGTTRATDYATICRAMNNIYKYINSKLMISECIDETGHFDYFKFGLKTGLLDDGKQREMLVYMHINVPARRIQEITQHFPTNTDRQQIDRVKRIIRKIFASVGVTFDLRTSAHVLDESFLLNADEKTLFEQLGISPMYYYNHLLTPQLGYPIKILHAEMLKYMREHPEESLYKVANKFGYSISMLKYIKKYSNIELPPFDISQYPYHPRKIKIQNAFKSIERIDDKLIDHWNYEVFSGLQKKTNACS